MNDVIEEHSALNQTHWLQNSADVSFVFSAGAIGAIVGLIPSVPLTTRFGIRNILAFYSFSSSIATLLVPLAVSIGYYPVVAARLIQALGGNMSLMTLMIYGPTYLNKVLGLDVKDTGFANAIPYILATAVKFTAGPLSDKLTSVPDTWKMIFFAAVAQGGMACGFFVMALTRDKLIAQIAYTAAIVLAGVNMIGVVKCAQMVSRQYIHFVMAVNSLISWVAIFILPMIIGFLCPNHTPEEWSVFYIAGGIWVIVMNIPFPFLATTEAADFTKPGFGEKKVGDVEGK
uniref:MFS transporter n=1 Tax=Caenorhabditis tropicalis TaxID=1561998 RepID=A0A1I7TUZ3_9PELO